MLAVLLFVLGLILIAVEVAIILGLRSYKRTSARPHLASPRAIAAPKALGEIKAVEEIA